jgi:hypothetical protein
VTVAQLQVPVLARWRRLCAPSFVVAGITALIVWAAVADLLRLGRLETVLSAGRAELAAPLLITLVVATYRALPGSRVNSRTSTPSWLGWSSGMSV